MAGIYVHIPFCGSKCGYCDFYSVTSLALVESVLGRILSELESERGFIGDASVDTIYIGGGTPSLLTHVQLGAIIEKIRLLWDCRGLKEVTVEANPDDLSEDYLAALATTGINRLSIGIQSFSDSDLSFMNRRHSAGQAVGAVRMARSAGFNNISIDLIYGIPGMSATQWRSNVELAAGLGVQHISAYHLTIEEGTAFGRLAAVGGLLPITDESSEEQYRILRSVLADAGFEHYEISNFALPGRRALHNSSYWNGTPYLGVGPSAHSFDGHMRRSSPRSIEKYLEPPHDGYYMSETLTGKDHYNEFIMTSLRCSEGINTDLLRQRFGDAAADEFAAAAGHFVRCGMIVRNGDVYRIPPEKFLVSDSVISALFV